MKLPYFTNPLVISDIPHLSYCVQCRSVHETTGTPLQYWFYYWKASVYIKDLWPCSISIFNILRDLLTLLHMGHYFILLPVVCKCSFSWTPTYALLVRMQTCIPSVENSMEASVCSVYHSWACVQQQWSHVKAVPAYLAHHNLIHNN